MYGTAINSAISSYCRANGFNGAGSFDGKNTVRQNSPDEKDLCENLRKFDGFENNDASGVSYLSRLARQTRRKPRKSPAKRKRRTPIL